MARSESVSMASRAEPRELGAFGVEPRKDEWRRWQVMAGVLIQFAVLTVLAALSLGTPDFADNAIVMGCAEGCADEAG